tara:strand:+ start:103 stop:471 length:369 start_codon:yes stop_codon:yes gene_type:complete
MKLLFIFLLMFLGCDYAPTEHSHSHEHHDLYSGCCLQLHPNDIAYTYINPEDGNEWSYVSSGNAEYYYNVDQIACLDYEAMEEYDQIAWDYIDNQTCDELCDIDNVMQNCYIDSVSILIPNP